MSSGVVEFNIGGYHFSTTVSTLSKESDSLLARLVSRSQEPLFDAKGRFFLDRDGQLFAHLLNCLRTDSLYLPKNFSDVELLAVEADFYRLVKLSSELKRHPLFDNKRYQELTKSHPVVPSLAKPIAALSPWAQTNGTSNGLHANDGHDNGGHSTMSQPNYSSMGVSEPSMGNGHTPSATIKNSTTTVGEDEWWRNSPLQTNKENTASGWSNSPAPMQKSTWEAPPTTSFSSPAPSASPSPWTSSSSPAPYSSSAGRSTPASTPAAAAPLRTNGSDDGRVTNSYTPVSYFPSQSPASTNTSSDPSRVASAEGAWSPLHRKLGHSSPVAKKRPDYYTPKTSNTGSPQRTTFV